VIVLVLGISQGEALGIIDDVPSEPLGMHVGRQQALPPLSRREPTVRQARRTCVWRTTEEDDLKRPT
jgi:hypothetical protein